MPNLRNGNKGGFERALTKSLTIARVNFGWGIVATKQNHMSVCHKRMFAWLTINTMLRVPHRTDSDTVTER